MTQLTEAKHLLEDIAAHTAAAVASRTRAQPPSAGSGERRATPDADEAPTYILLIEDDPDIAEVVADVLTDAGYAVKAFTHGGQAFDYLNQEFFESQRRALNRKVERFLEDQDEDAAETPVAPRLPALVLLDLMLPVRNGREIFALMRQREALRNVPVVVMSADHRISRLRDDLVNIEGILDEPNDALKKPFAHDELLEAVRRLAGPPPMKP